MWRWRERSTGSSASRRDPRQRHQRRHDVDQPCPRQVPGPADHPDRRLGEAEQPRHADHASAPASPSRGSARPVARAAGRAAARSSAAAATPSGASTRSVTAAVRTAARPRCRRAGRRLPTARHARNASTAVTTIAATHDRPVAGVVAEDPRDAAAPRLVERRPDRADPAGVAEQFGEVVTGLVADHQRRHPDRREEHHRREHHGRPSGARRGSTAR